MDTKRIYVGTYSGQIYTIEQKGKELTVVDTVKAGTSPSWLTLNERRTVLYATDEVDTYDGSGALLRFDVKNGKLVANGHLSTEGPSPAQASFGDNDRLLFVANYLGGNFTTVSTETQSTVECITFKDDAHLGPNSERQQQPHPHMLLPRKEFVYGCDLGQDRVFQWRLVDGILKPLDEPFLSASAGSGPRHIAFHPTENYAYVIHELDCTLTSYIIDEKGQLKFMARISTMPPEKSTESTGGAVIVSPDGKNVYVTNRGGYNSICTFKIIGPNLEMDAHMESGGQTPWQMDIDPSGKWIVVSNLGSNKVVLFSRGKDGVLTLASSIEVDKPTCAIYA